MEDKKMHSNVRSATIVKVVRVIEVRGVGTPDNPVRLWANYYDMNGTKLGEAPINSLSGDNNG